MKKDPTVPVYLITGFLDSGKTNFLKYTLAEPYFNDGSRSLLILCEDGEEEYEPALLKKTKTSLVKAEKEEDLTPEFFEVCQKHYLPDRVLIEFNGMWDIPKFLSLKLPKFWTMYQIITIADGANFSLYLQNIKMPAMTMLTNTDMVIFNRCRTDTDLIQLKRAFRSVNPKGDLVFEDERGNEVECPEPDLPYSVDSQDIEISDENWGTFYIDLNAHPERYINHRIHFLMQIMQNRKFPANMFIAGRRAMTCCVQDIRFLPYIFIYDKARTLAQSSWANITATMKWGFHEGYKEEGPVFYVEELRKTSEPKEDLITFN